VASLGKARRRPLVLWALFSLKGRVSRRVYWLATLFLIAVNSVLVGQMMGADEASYHRIAAALFPVVLVITLFANMAVAVKRLHDVGYSGFLALTLFVPLVNLAFALWVGILPGTAGPNSFGETPDVPPE
jgi:uncharacterized membrane protein YhaH (DUF805 family)